MIKKYEIKNLSSNKLKTFIKNIKFDEHHKINKSPWIYLGKKKFNFYFVIYNNLIEGVMVIFNTNYNSHLSFLYINKNFRNKGLGSKLVKKFLHSNKKLKTVHVYKNLKKTQKFYESFNFKKFSHKLDGNDLKNWYKRCINFDKKTFKNRYLYFFKKKN